MKKLILMFLVLGYTAILWRPTEGWARSPFFTADDIMDAEHLPLEEELSNE